jgi:DNA mismatch repair protein MutS
MDGLPRDPSRPAPPRALPSLLWPPGSAPGVRLDSQVVVDLDLPEVIQALCGGEPRRERFVHDLLAAPCADPAVIAYRAEALDDLLADAALRAALRATLPALEALAATSRPRSGEGALFRLTQRLSALELYVDAARQLQQALARPRRRAAALEAVYAALQALTATPTFAALQAELPAVRQRLGEVRSVTIGVNLSDDLQPAAAALLALHAEPIAGPASLLARLLGRPDGQHGLTPLRPSDLGPDNRLLGDLRRLLDRVIDPLERALERFAALSPAALAGLAPELAFLLDAASLTLRLRDAGLPVCRPVLARREGRVCAVREGYHLGLALRLLGRSDPPPTDAAAAVVTNAMTFDETAGRVWILTGPNRGGKTTYTRAVGLLQVLAQAGLPVPARAARLSPVDAIYTHFPAPEGATLGRGRLDDEAARLAAIFGRATPHSLILLNEVLAGTSTTKALGLAIDAVRGLRLLGARAIYVTHLHELAERVGEINARTAGDGVVGSLVADAAREAGEDGVHDRTFRVYPGPPRGVSYASDIAARHGIGYAQLEQLLRARGILPLPPGPSDDGL